MSFTGDIRKLLGSKGRQVEESKVGSLSVFTLKDVKVVPVPISSRSQEEALEVYSLCQQIMESSKDTEEESQTLFLVQDRWASQKESMTKRLLAHVGEFHSVFARNCEVRKIDKLTAGEFLSDCHSYGDAACKYRYGLYVTRYSGEENKKDYEGEHPVPVETLVAVSEFSNARKWVKGDKTIKSYEWIRYASLPGVRVIGGMGKMLRSFIADVQPDDVMSYADLEWSDGRAYRELGFEQEDDREPVDFYIDPLFWSRVPVGKGEKPDGALYYRNFGSRKYRLKLTEY
ncbi:MAG: hypothetical protein MJZ16_01850 [Bacteroidales bacterium]|nr:hypothetical protein [Bacteroidales bacterium]